MKTGVDHILDTYAVVTDRYATDLPGQSGEPLVVRESGNMKVYAIFSELSYREAILKKASLNGMNFGNIWVERLDK